MKKSSSFFRLIVALLLLQTAINAHGANWLFRRGKSNYQIVVAANASTSGKTAAKELQEYLQTVADSNPDTTVMINCGPNAKHKKLVKLLDMCSDVGLNKLNIVEDESVLDINQDGVINPLDAATIFKKYLNK